MADSLRALSLPISFVAAPVRRQIANRVPCVAPGENIRTKADVAEYCCGQPPAKRPQDQRRPGPSRVALRISAESSRRKRLTLSKRLNLPVTILRGITRSHPEHGS